MGSQPHLNGSLGTVDSWDEGHQRWKVRMDDGSGKILKPTNLQTVGPAEVPVSKVPNENMGASMMPSFMGAGAPPVVQKQDNLSISTLLPGMRVCIVGLVTQSDLNGQNGSLIEWDPVQERWKVRLDDGSGKLLKTTNLRLVDPLVVQRVEDLSSDGMRAGTRVRVAGLKTQTQLNGHTGTLVEWDSEQERWKVRMDDGSGKLLKLVNLETLPPRHDSVCGHEEVDDHLNVDAEHKRKLCVNSAQRLLIPNLAPRKHVRICGLQARPELNGQCGVIEAWDEVEQRYLVRMDDESLKILRPLNLQCLD